MIIRPSQNGEITLLFTYIGKSCLSCEIFNVANMYFKAFRENKILAKISEFTVSDLLSPRIAFYRDVAQY